ncbi:hypothetical protein [Halomarina litorea]|uniref:hypothetical protein n=1 Tax=Halomarina litorea TaxID=2961595 RepID=UPI0020C505C0|nr:hypothetical protein [Halomarina sp. BCD28]
MSTNSVRKLISRTIDGVEALVNTESGEIFIDVPAETPQYIRVGEGDVIREGDVRSRAEKELDSSTLKRWTVERIGRKTVVGTDEETGERREWERDSLERQLATGGLSTTLTDFERTNVVGGTKTADHEGEMSRESVVVILYGSDGRKFTQTYRVTGVGTDGDGQRVELVESDKRAEAFEPALRERFDQTAEDALRKEGYAL